MTRDKHFPRFRSLQQILAITQMTAGQRRIDADIVFFRFIQLRQLVFTQTKSPAFLVIRRAIRNPIGLVRNCVKMFLEFSKAHTLMNRHTVTDYVQVKTPKVDQALPLPNS